MAKCWAVAVMGIMVGMVAGRKACGDEPPSPAQLWTALERLRPLHEPLGVPGPHDWLAHHDEPGQTFEQYLASKPVVPRGERHVLYVQPLGSFTPTQRRIITLTADFLARFYGLSVVVRDDLPLSAIPDRARRTQPEWGMEQILTSYVLDELLYPKLPNDAAVYIALTATDLWAGPGWNFVFGQASLRKRVGVWSIHRNGDPDAGPEAFRLCLLRTLKTAVHEVGHMFSMRHCTRYECGMCGSNHQAEKDARPLWFCPECVAKVWFATGSDPIERFRKLAEFCRENRLEPESSHYEKALKRLAGDR
ncbi:MAG: hypothetical protein JXR37_13210 [Kiritimatiellae bacterium]|nr:hypothetical protein [Kiritimatiellia bacterium]